MNLHIAAVHEGKNSYKYDVCHDYFSNKEELNCHREDIHKGNKLPFCGPDGKNFESSVKNTFNFRFVTAGDITRIVRNLNNTKAIGTDGISTEVLEKGINVLASPIARICNVSLSTGIVPDCI